MLRTIFTTAIVSPRFPKIVSTQRGAHQALLAQDGVYAKPYPRQFAYEQRGGSAAPKEATG